MDDDAVLGEEVAAYEGIVSASHLPRAPRVRSDLLCMLLFFGGRSSCDRQRHETQQGETDRQQGAFAQKQRCCAVPASSWG